MVERGCKCKWRETKKQGGLILAGVGCSLSIVITCIFLSYPHHVSVACISVANSFRECHCVPSSVEVIQIHGHSIMDSHNRVKTSNRQ